MGDHTLVSMSHKTQTNVSGFVPDANLKTLCLGSLNDPEVSLQAAGTLLLMGIQPPIAVDGDFPLMQLAGTIEEDAADAERRLYMLDGSVSSFAAALVGFRSRYQSEENAEYAAQAVRRVQFALAGIPADERADCMRRIREGLAWADPKRVSL